MASLGAVVLIVDLVALVLGVGTSSGAPGPARLVLAPAHALDASRAAVGEGAPVAAPAATASERPIAPAPDHFDGALAPGAGDACTGQPPGPPPSGGTWAVTVGINDYPGDAHDLLASVNDARAMDTALSRLGVAADHRLLLTDGAAAVCGVTTALDWLVDHAQPGSTAVFFFSGHARLTGAHRVLVAADGGLVSDSELGDSLSRLQASRAWIALATCYGAGFTQVLAPGRILTGAAGANDLAYEEIGSERSYMGEYMIQRALVEGGAPSSVEAAFAYSVSALGAVAPNRAPVEIDQAAGELDLRPSPSVALPANTAVPAGGGNTGGGGGAPPPPTVPPPARPPVVPTTRACILNLLCIG